MQDELVERIRLFSVSNDPLSTATAETFVDAFSPLSHAHAAPSGAPSSSFGSTSALSKLKQARSTALLTLASRSSSASVKTPLNGGKAESSRTNVVDENIAQLLTPLIRSRLADTTPDSLLSALNFFSALFSVLPSEAHDILTADGILNLVLEAPDACNALVLRNKEGGKDDGEENTLVLSDEELVSLAVAELLSSAANSTATRKYLAGQQAVLDWLDIAGVPHRRSTDSPGKVLRSNAVAVVAGLADVKVYRAIDSEAMHGLTQSASSQPTSQQDHVRKIQESRSERKRKDDTLYQTARAELVGIVTNLSAHKEETSVADLGQADTRRTIELSCLEVLAYLTVQSSFKEHVAKDKQLLDVLCTGFKMTAPRTSDRDLTVDMDSQRFDGALQLGLVTILSNVTAYPPVLTAEEKQARRLRKFANAQGDKQGGSQEQQDEELETAARVEQRCTAVFEAKAIETLGAIAVTGSPPSSSKVSTEDTKDVASWKVNPSKSVRRACGAALLALLTKQDRIMRGKAVQQGALKAVLALSAPILHALQTTQSKSAGMFARASEASATAEVNAEDLAPLQALAKLLISLNPSLLFPSSDGLVSVASVTCSLLLCPSASRLQRFEALLALTNLASLSPEVCMRIAQFSLEHAEKETGEGQDASQTFSTTSVLAQACEQLLMEDHVMVRRAWIELLVNLLQVEAVFGYFVAVDRPSATKSAPEPQDRLCLRLRMLLGLSEADEWAYTNKSKTIAPNETSDPSSEGGGGGEASLATRMASLAVLATVTESSTAIEGLLTFERLFPVLLGNLVLDRSEDEERNDWERADLEPAVADANRSSKDLEAEAHLNGINLSLRASFVLLNVMQYLKEHEGGISKVKAKFDQAKILSTLQQSLGYHIKQLQQESGPDHVQEARKGLLQVMAECLKLVKDI
ncbi:UNC45-central domain-containing protein [Pseudozyma hubeiensis]|nr:UNC45-central domain-containing protein [Pseudozyma hubeiensis]